MNPGQWRIVEKLYNSASEMSVGERESFLQEACGQDQSLFEEVESLLRYGSTPQSVLDTPAIAILAKAIAADELEFPAPSLEGKTISHYRILECVGRGGMGVVYKAEDLRLQRYVALKLLPKFLATDREALKRFEQEAQAASALNHPNICTVYEVDEAQGLHFIAIELLDGETLKQRIARGPLDVGETLGVGVAICDALEAAHSAGIIHRDIKPSNIVLTRRGIAKLLDFGVAKRIGPELVRQTEDLLPVLPRNVDTRLTSAGAAIGTVAYMSPEQAGGKEVDARSDLFSLGTVLYEMTTGKYPFPGKDLGDFLRAIQEQVPASTRQLNPKVPSGLIRITKKAMHKDRSLRYQRAAEMQADLLALRSRLDAGIGKRKALLVLTLILLFVLAMSASMRVPRFREWIAGRPLTDMRREIKSIAVLPLENLTGDSTQDYLVDGMTDALITDLGRLRSLRVISRTSAMRYKGARTPIAQMARELNVEAFLEGSVVRSGNRIRINAQLIQAMPERHLWANAYERDLGDILMLQNDVAWAIAGQVQAKVSPEERVLLATARPVNPQAYEAYLKGEYFLGKWSTEGLDKAKDYFQQSIDLDPTYAPGYTGMGDYYSLIAFMGMAPPREAYLKAEDFLKKALELDGTNTDPYVLLAMIKLLFRCDPSGAEKDLNRVLEVNPGNVNALDYHSYYLVEVGRMDEAIVEKRRVLEQDPLAVETNSELGMYLLRAGRNDEAIQQLQKTLELDPNYAATYTRLGKAYANKSQYGKAIVELKKAIALDKTPDRMVALADVYDRWGKRQESRALLDELIRISRHRYTPPHLIAGVYARLGEKEAALAWLEKASEHDPPDLSLPEFDLLRSDPRFSKLEVRFKGATTCRQ